MCPDDRAGQCGGCARTVLYSTVQYCTVQYITVLYSTVRYCTVRYCTVLYSTVQYCIVHKCDPTADRQTLFDIKVDFQIAITSLKTIEK